MDGRRKCSKAVDLFFLEFQRGMKIVFKRDFQIGVSQNFAERFGIHAICDTASGKRVPDCMKIQIAQIVTAENNPGVPDENMAVGSAEGKRAGEPNGWRRCFWDRIK